jgi:peptidyl-prolyl cis-trans isomerase D
VYGIGMEVSGTGGGRPGELGSVNGQPITLEAYQLKVQQLQQQYQEQGGGRLSAEQQRQLEDRAWEDLVSQILLEQEMSRRGIGVSDDEIRYAAMNVPAPQIANQEIFQTNGQFDIAKYRQFLGGPQASDELLAQLEQYYREVIPQSKLQRQVSAGTFVSDAELWRMWQDQNEQATVEYVALDLSKLVKGTPAVSPAEIRRHYNENKDDFERPRTARMTVAYLPTSITPADQAATLQKAQRLRAEIAGGADFAEVAKRESTDQGSAAQGGDLGTVTRGQMVAPFDQAVFSLPVGQLSEPVQTQFGYHLIQVTERADTLSAKARHILIPMGKSDEELARLDARADSLETLAQSQGIERAARAVGATLRQGVTVSDQLPYIPGVGPALESLQWAAGEWASREGDEKPVSDVFDSEQAFYVVRVDNYLPKGEMTLNEATPQIKEKLIVEKKRAQARRVGEQIVAAVRGGQSLQQAAAASGLSVQTHGPFTRVAANPVFGQATAAVGAAFGTPLNGVSNVVETPAGLFIIRPTQRTAADRRAFETQKAELRSVAVMRLQQEQTQRWLDSVRRRADIEDNRDEVFNAVASS